MNNISKVQAMTNKQKVNHQGGVGYETPFKESLIEFFSLGLLNGNFYQTQESVLKDANELLERALREEPVFATKCAIYGNNTNSLKLVPTIWLVYLSTLNDKTLFKKAFPQIIKNPKMLFDFVEIARKGGIREGLGRSTKKVINEWLLAKLNEYQVTRNKGKLSDIVKLTRPNHQEPMFQQYMKYIAKDELSFPRAIALKSVINQLEEGIVNANTLELIEEYRLQLEELKHATANLDAESKMALYTKMYEGLNYTALILNLVALERVFATKVQTVQKYRSENGYYQQKLILETDIPNDLIRVVVSKINDIEQYRKSNMLPFALFNAEKMVITPEFKHAISNMLKTIAGEAFNINKSVELMVGVDTSGSMSGSDVSDSLTALDVATIFGALVKKSHAKTNTYAVATETKPVKLNKQDDLFDMANQIRETEVGYGTYFENLLKHYNGEKYVILMTDSESADNLESRWLKLKKPAGAKLIVWQLSPNRTKVSNDSSVVYVYGYSDRLLGLIKNIIEDNIAQVDEIEKMKI